MAQNANQPEKPKIVITDELILKTFPDADREFKDLAAEIAQGIIKKYTGYLIELSDLGVDYSYNPKTATHIFRFNYPTNQKEIKQ